MPAEVNQLTAVLDPALRESITGWSNPALFRHRAALKHPDTRDPTGDEGFTLRLLTRRNMALTRHVTRR